MCESLVSINFVGEKILQRLWGAELIVYKDGNQLSKFWAK